MANIMIVDHSPVIRRDLRSILEGMGHHITAEAEDGESAVQLHRKNPFEIIVMNIQLPGISGIEALHLIRQYDPQGTVVMLCSLDQRNKIYEAVKAGAQHYIVKPFTERKVKEVIQAVLESAEATPSLEPVEGRTLMKLQSQDIEGLPFELFHMDGCVVLIIRRWINSANIKLLHACLQGLLFYRKKKFVIEIWEPVYHDLGNQLLLDFISIVREQKGVMKVVTDDPDYWAALKSEIGEEVYRSYQEIEW